MNHFLRKHFMLYGKTKFTLMALISISIQTVMLKLSPSGPWLWESNIPLFVGAGYVVPALIAHDMGRQGIKQTTKAVLLAGVIVALPIALALALQLKGVNDLAPLAGFGTMSIDNRWIPTAVLLSAAASWGVAQHYNLKSGGFVGAAYIGMFMGDPYQVLVAFTVAIVTFLVVRYGLMNVLILFGRRKFSAMLLTSSMISWTLLWAGPSFLSVRVTNHLDLASMALTPLFVPGLLANDMDRTSPLRVVTGCGLAAAFVVPTTWWIQSLVEGGSLGLPWIGLSLATFVIIFWKSARQLYRHYRPVQEVEDEWRRGSGRSRRRLLGACRRTRPGAGRRRSEPDIRRRVRARVRESKRSSNPRQRRQRQRLLPKSSPGRSSSDARQTGRGATGRRRPCRPRCPTTSRTSTGAAFVPNVYSIDSTGWSATGNKRWQSAHPDAWEDADRWLAEALTPDDRDLRVVA